jgi:hypothetical protein
MEKEMKEGWYFDPRKERNCLCRLYFIGPPPPVKWIGRYFEPALEEVEIGHRVFDQFEQPALHALSRLREKILKLGVKESQYAEALGELNQLLGMSI